LPLLFPLRHSAIALERFMFSIGRIPVLKLNLLIVSVSWLLSAGAPVANAQDPQPIAVPLVPVATTRWISPPGHVTDRQLVMRLTRFQEAVQGPLPEDMNWIDLLEKVHLGILGAAEDTLVTPANKNFTTDPHPVPLSPIRPPLRSLKTVTEEIIADLPAAGREAWLRLIADRAEAEFDDAARTGNWKTLNRIASQDVHSPAGYKAADLIGNQQLDQNRPVAALRQFNRLLKSETARLNREPFLSIRTAAAWHSLGRVDQARVSLIDLAVWLKKHPEIATSVPAGAVPEVTEVSAWLRRHLPPASVKPDPEPENPYYAGGLLPRSAAAAFSPDARVLWKSQTSGFDVTVTDENREKFLVRLEDEDAVGPEVGSVPDRLQPNAKAKAPAQQPPTVDPEPEREGILNGEPYPISESETAALVDVGLQHLARRDHRRKKIALPACEPIAVNGRAIFRTLNRVRAVDLTTGKLQWESFLTDPAFAEQFDLRQARRSLNVPQDSDDITNPLNKRQSAVIYSRSRLDRTAGTLSTDGNVLFTLEEGGVTAKATSYRQPGARHAAPNSWNRLCAFDLATGTLRWQIGGPEGEYELPAAGVFFLGVPTALEDSIYVLGEQATWIRLFCLEPSTGKIKWAQSVATANVAVSGEGLRRVGGISPCSAAGLIICPSISGLVVAYDPEQQRLAWTNQYRSQVMSRSISFRMRQALTRVNTINLDSPDRWRFDSTLVLSGRVVLTPLDSQELMCIDAVSGDTLWTKPRGQGLFIGAAFEDQIIIVDDSAVRAISLNDGSLSWKVALNQRIPTGRGLRTGSLFHLPIANVTLDDPAQPTSAETGNPATDDTEPRANGKLVTIDLATGRLLAESDSPDGLPLGNIVAHDGQLLTQRFDSVLALESLASVESQLAKQLEQNPRDGVAFESRARIRLHEGRLEEGLTDLQFAVQNNGAATALTLLVEQALEQLRRGQELNDETKRVLATAQLDAVHRNAIDAVRCDRLVGKGSFTAAFDLLLNTPEIDPETSAAFIVHSDPLSLSSKAWIAARLQSVYETAMSNPGDSVKVESLNQTIRQQLDIAKSEPEPAPLRTWLSRFAWHALASEATVALAERLASKEDGTKTDGLEIDALWAILASDTNEQIASNAKASQLKPTEAIAWPDASPTVKKASHSPDADRRILAEVSGNRSPVIRGWEFELTQRGLTALGPSGNPQWKVTDKDLGSDPLLTTSRHNSSRIFSSGHLLAVSTGTEFSVFDIRDPSPRRLWKKSLVSRNEVELFQMRRFHPLGSTVLYSGSSPVGSVDFLNSHCLVYRTGSTLRVVSATTGETIWTRDRIPPDALIFGDELLLCVAAVRNAHCQLFDLRSGRLVQEHFEIPLNGLLATAGTDVIVRQNRGVTHLVTRFDMRSGEATWKYEIPNSAVVRPTKDGRLVELHLDGQIVFREQSSGKVVIDVQGEKQSIPGIFYLHETPTEYVVFTATRQRSFQSRVRPLNLQGSRQDNVEGPAYGIDRRTGKILWTTEIEPQYFAAAQPSALPFVVLACQSRKVAPDKGFAVPTRSFPVRVLNTRTGKTLFASEDDMDIMNFGSSGDVKQNQVSLTYGKTVVHFDYSDSKKDPAEVPKEDSKLQQD
jgi:outer membrane protein assembly factor BamB